MATWKDYTEIKSWQEALELYVEYRNMIGRSEILEREYDLRSQMTRASLSIMNNIAEGFGRQSNKEFARFLSIARGSCYEFESMVHALAKTEMLTEAEAEFFFEKTAGIRRNLAGLSQYLYRKEREQQEKEKSNANSNSSSISSSPNL